MVHMNKLVRPLFRQIIADIKYMDNDELKEVARQSRVAFVTLRNWRTLQTSSPRLDTFLKVATTLGYEVTMTHSSMNMRRAA